MASPVQVDSDMFDVNECPAPQVRPNTHVFIVRLWCERREIRGAPPLLRGTVEHVPSGERRYVQSLNDIILFMSRHLDECGAKRGVAWRLKRWLTDRSGNSSHTA